MNRPSLSLLRRRVRRGITLLEVIIALALIAVIAAALIGNLGGILGRGQEDAARLFVDNAVKLPMQNYRIHLGRFPASLDDLKTAPQDGASRWRGPYVERTSDFLDPWGEPYQYRFPGTNNPDSYDLWSIGPDGQDGTADDITNW